MRKTTETLVFSSLKLFQYSDIMAFSLHICPFPTLDRILVVYVLLHLVSTSCLTLRLYKQPRLF